GWKTGHSDSNFNAILADPHLPFKPRPPPAVGRGLQEPQQGQSPPPPSSSAEEKDQNQNQRGKARHRKSGGCGAGGISPLVTAQESAAALGGCGRGRDEVNSHGMGRSGERTKGEGE
ncbi:unnamed protein product, partial [Discosporangium mesarthrocarpum]